VGEKLIDKIKRAMVKDFNELYKPKFSINYQAERVTRAVEVEVMSISNVFGVVDKEIKKLEEKVYFLEKKCEMFRKIINNVLEREEE